MIRDTKRPSSLRPDAVGRRSLDPLISFPLPLLGAALMIANFDVLRHTNDYCLNLSTGTRVIEGWTRHLAYWLREKGRANKTRRGV